MSTSMNDSNRGLTGVAESLFLFLLVWVASTRLIVKTALQGSLFGSDSPLLYQAATLGFNYFEFGAVRRGLGGTMTYLIGGDLLVATMLFHLTWAAAVAGGVVVLIRRMQAPMWVRLTYAIVVIAVMLRWAEDAGRTDMAIAALLAMATVAVQRGRLDVAVAFLSVGIFIHESAMIFGLPLLVALVYARGGWASFAPRARIGAVAMFVLGIAAYASLGWLPQAGTQAMVDGVRAKFVPHEYVDWAIYFAVSGMRGVVTSICQNWTDPSYFVHPFGGAVVLCLAWIALSWRKRDSWLAMAVAALPGFVFLCIVANDIARWTMFALFNIWLVGVTLRRGPGRPGIPPWASVAAALAIVPLTHPKPNKIEFPIYAGSPAIEWAVRKLHGPRTPSVQEALQRCDPQWRQVLGDRL